MAISTTRPPRTSSTPALARAGLGHMRDKQEPFGHEKIETTMRYVHYVPKLDAAAKDTAFIDAQLDSVPHCAPSQRIRATLRATERN